MILGILGGIGLNVYLQQYPMTVVYAAEPEQPVVVLIGEYIEWTPERIKQEIENKAVEYGVSSEVMHTVIRCESQYNPNALGDGGKSRGLVQIHRDYHDVSDEDAYDPEFAITFLAEHLKAGQGNLWSCYNMNY